MKQKIIIPIVVSILVILASTSVAWAATSVNSQLTQTISSGTLSTSMRTSSGVAVGSPSFSMSAATVSASTQTTTGVYGDSEQRITVDDSRGNGGGWTLALAGTNGATTVWTDGAGTPHTYPFNGTTTTGRLTVNPAVATITPTSPNTITGVSKGTSASFSAATPITIMAASSSTEKVWNGYMTGVGLSQIVPALQTPGNYTIDLTQTVTAL